ncbi:auxilin-like clathrin-binding protein required for normal clathrin function [Coemansia erecta]|nr:auxilin-like clathrin-binding protein required for normal clathrin function [Coemansia erecta]
MDTRQPAREAFADRDFEIAQVAGYGFSVEQSKAALEITGSPRAAIQLLREQKAAARNAPKPEMQQKPPAGRSRLRTPYRDEPGRADDSSSDDELYYDDPRHNRRHEADRRRDNARPQQADQGGSDSFLTTANELGTSMLKQANSWFAMGKKKFMEIQESVEQRRWPGNDAEAEWNRADFEPGYAGSGSRRYRDYSDSSSDDEPYVSASRHARQPAKTFEPFESTKPRQRPAHAAEPIMDMMGDFDAAPVAIPRQQQPRPSAAPSQTQSTPTPARKQQSPAAIPIVSDNILVAATTAKISANAQFKLGQYGEAAAGYSVAISQVSQHSDSHPVLILLLNNRALAYARNGEAKMAVTDCTQALQLIDRFQTNGTIELGQAGRVDMGEQRAKTLQRRAEAFESSERYQDGLSDWKALREIARDAGMRQQSTRGVQRCERALGISQTPKRPVAAETPEPAKPEDLANVFASISIATVKSGGPTILTAHTENSAAVAEMRRKEQVRRDEDDQRMAIHDHVEAELRQWKDGKQQNLRALLSSVHLLLPSFTPIGMHEIIEAAKVKRAYMRTIARLHPDKLTKDIDVRTKMVSSSVFTSLNEAWDTFKAQEGVS